MSSTFLEDNSNSTNNNTSHNISIATLINEININSLNDYYEVENSLFKKKLEKLNLKFYWESESLSNVKEIPKPYSKLLLILLKEINLYTEEIDRLNKILQEKDKNEKLIKDKLFEISQKEKERLLSKQMLKNYQKINKLLEKKVEEKTLNESKYKLEIEKLKNKLKDNHINIGNTCSKANQLTQMNQIKDEEKIIHKYNYSVDNKKKKKNKDLGQKKINKNLNNYLSVDTTNINEINEENEDNKINSDFLNQILIHYNDEIENLEQIEQFLENHKKEIDNSFTKPNFSVLKNTIKNLPY